MVGSMVMHQEKRMRLILKSNQCFMFLINFIFMVRGFKRLCREILKMKDFYNGIGRRDYVKRLLERNVFGKLFVSHNISSPDEVS